jgi:alternate signal-mediated exported protein
MSATTTTTTTEKPRRSRRGIGLLAGIAGGLLLIGGTTYALWSDNALQAGGTIVNGNLDAAPVGTTTYWDVSADRLDATATTPVTALDAHSVADITAYSIVPGDVLEANYGFAVALEGDNLVAALTVELPGGAPATGVSFTAQAYYLDGATWTAVGTPTAVVPGGSVVTLGNFQADNQLNGALDPSIPVITLTDAATAATPNVTVIVTATFDAATTDRISAEATSTLGDVTVTLNQVRTAGVGNFG